jgi:predicted nucleic acid-binding protein
LIETHKISLIVTDSGPLIALSVANLLGLGSGEVSVLAYAKLKNWIALIDERGARRIASVNPALVAWRAHGYFFSDGVITDILKAANETEISPP